MTRTNGVDYSLHLITDEAWHDLCQGPIRGVSRYARVWERKQ